MAPEGSEAQIIEDISAHFLGPPEGAFDGDEAMLRTVIRISVESFRFIQTNRKLETVDIDELDYLVDTIRSGIDAFFYCQQHFRVAAGHKWGGPKWTVHAEFASLRTEYLELVCRLRSGDTLLDARRDSLMRLVELQLQFMAANFHRSEAASL